MAKSYGEAYVRNLKYKLDNMERSKDFYERKNVEKDVALKAWEAEANDFRQRLYTLNGELGNPSGAIKKAFEVVQNWAVNSLKHAEPFSNVFQQKSDAVAAGVTVARDYAPREVVEANKWLSVSRQVLYALRMAETSPEQFEGDPLGRGR